jgi:diaminopropionate ammonia-lyase
VALRDAAVLPGGRQPVGPASGNLLHYQRADAALSGGAPVDGRAWTFHRQLPGYRPTPLLSCDALAAACRVGRVLVKVESQRFGLPSFKFMGASWAAYRMIEERCGGLQTWSTLEELAKQIDPDQMRLITATDGNHGRAVAHLAKRLGLLSLILLPKGSAQVRIDDIAAEGAVVDIVDGTYDDAVARAAELSVADPDWLLVADTADSDTCQSPLYVIDGYETIMVEVEQQLAHQGMDAPDVIVVQAGVGAFAAAVARHQWRNSALPRVVIVEPEDAACVTASLMAGTLAMAPGPHLSRMAGLNCSSPSAVAWPILEPRVEAAVLVTDADAEDAMRRLSELGLVSGESGAAGLAGLLRIGQDPQLRPVQDALSIGPECSVLVFITEGATDPGNYERVTGKPPHLIG